jgi:hypothetical protein
MAMEGEEEGHATTVAGLRRTMVVEGPHNLRMGRAALRHGWEERRVNGMMGRGVAASREEGRRDGSIWL